eukprot:2878433-Lingulodinium_polyedra.AAC.1
MGEEQPEYLKAMDFMDVLAKGWAKPCVKIAGKDLGNLQRVFDAAVRLGGKESLRAINEDGVEV